MTWDKEAMKKEVTRNPDRIEMNWSYQARRQKMKNSSDELETNGGQIAQEWLKSVGVYTDSFKRLQTGVELRVRQGKVRRAGGEITVATSPTNAENIQLGS